MKAWQVQLFWCCLTGLSACSKHSDVGSADDATTDAAGLDGENGGQVRVGDPSTSSSASTGTGTSDAAAAGSSSAGVGAGAEAGGRSFPGFPTGQRAGSGAGSRPGRGGSAGRTGFPGFAGTGGGFSRRPPRDRDPQDEDAGVVDASSEPTPAADGGVVTEPEAGSGGAGAGGASGAAGEGGAGAASTPPESAGSGGVAGEEPVAGESAPEQAGTGGAAGSTPDPDAGAPAP
jgi:hypothetical protein